MENADWLLQVTVKISTNRSALFQSYSTLKSFYEIYSSSLTSLTGMRPAWGKDRRGPGLLHPETRLPGPEVRLRRVEASQQGRSPEIDHNLRAEAPARLRAGHGDDQDAGQLGKGRISAWTTRVC